jgi:hypothetical protein
MTTLLSSELGIQKIDLIKPSKKQAVKNIVAILNVHTLFNSVRILVMNSKLSPGTLYFSLPSSKFTNANGKEEIFKEVELSKEAEAFLLKYVSELVETKVVKQFKLKA